MKIFKNILFNIFVILMSAVILFVGFILISGAKGYAVISHSMEPIFSKGDVIFSKDVAFEDLKVGDVVTFSHGEDSKLTTHRIEDIDKEKKQFLTKGDSNKTLDPEWVLAENVKGIFWFSIPFAGYLSFALYGKDVLIVLAVTAVVLLFYRIAYANKRKNDGGESDEKC